MWNSSKGEKSKRKRLENALEAECYSEASSAAFISLFLISITALYIERETGIEPATYRVERRMSFIAFRGLKGPLASLGNRVTIENKAHRVHGGLSEPLESLRNPTLNKTWF